MRLGGFGFDSPGKDAAANKSPKQLTGAISPSASTAGEFDYSRLPPVGFNEIELFVDSPLKKKPREATRSEKKSVGCFNFDILVFGAGNQTSFAANPKVAVYVECVGVDGKDERWVYNSVKFSVCLVNFKDYRKSIYHEDTHSFCASAVDRGWPELISHSELTPESGWLDDKGRLCVRAAVCNRQADTIFMSTEYDTRKETGFIGLKNHGATCYLNGLLQSYFLIGKFRELVYQMVDDAAHGNGSESPSGPRMSLPLALQSVFLRLETAESAVNTMELTRSFGWDSMDAFTQHDVQELARILCDKLEEKLKGTPGDRAIQNLFQGQVENYIECLDIAYKSTKRESFYDVPLNVRGFTGEPISSLEEALRAFTAVEVMEGENAYDAESLGKQRARKGIRFVEFPPVLAFQLKRFSFDFEKLDNVKLHDRFEFPTELEVDEFLPNSGQYVLHTVLVHSGDVHSGHYYAFVRPFADSDQWFRFDDEQVSRCSEYAAVNDNFGGEDIFPVDYFTTGNVSARRPVSRPRIHSAYMLVYIRRSDLASVLAQPSIVEVQDRVLAEARRMDERKRVQEEARQVIKLTVCTGSDLTGLTEFEAKRESSPPTTFELPVKRESKVVDVADAIAKSLFGFDDSKEMALFYLHSSSVGKLPPKWTLLSPYAAGGKTRGAATASKQLIVSSDLADRSLADVCPDDLQELTLLAVVGEGGDQLQAWTDGSPYSLVTVKYFDPTSLQLTTVGVRYVAIDTKIASLLPYLASQVGGTPDLPETWLAFEEVIGGDIRALEILATFAGERISGPSAVLIFQANTITDAETEESSEDDSALVPSVLPPKFVIRTVADYAHSLTARVNAHICVHSATEPAVTDGIRANGAFDEAVTPSVPSLDIAMDARWNLRVVVSEVIKMSGEKFDQKTHRMELYEQDPTLVKEAPIATSDDLVRIGRIGKVGACRRLVPDKDACEWTLHAVVVARNSICVRVFDSAVVEQCAVMVPVDGGRTVREVTETVTRSASLPRCEYRLVEHHKSQITAVHRGGDEVDLDSILNRTVNPLYEYLRMEPDEAPAAGEIECFVSHVDRSSGIHFGYPFVLAIDPHATAKQVKAVLQAKLHTTEKQVGRWRLCIESTGGKLTHLKDDDPIVVGSRKDRPLLVLEHNHPNPELMGVHRAMTAVHKPLTIR